MGQYSDAFKGSEQDVAKALSIASESIQLAKSRNLWLFDVKVSFEEAIRLELIVSEDA